MRRTTTRCVAVFAAIAAGALVDRAGAEDNPLVACLVTASQDSRLDPLRDKLVVAVPGEETFAMLADQSMPTDQQRAAISIWSDGKHDCVTKWLPWWQEHFSAELVDVAVEVDNQMTFAAVDLYNRKITFGEFNRRSKVARADVKQRVAAIVARIQTAQRQQQDQQAAVARQEDWQRQQLAEQEELQRRQLEAQDDIARRQMAMQVLLRQMRPVAQPAPLVPYQVPVRPIVNTNCMQTGNQVHCTSQ